MSSTTDLMSGHQMKTYENISDRGYSSPQYSVAELIDCHHANSILSPEKSNLLPSHLIL
jgi:hypothetical protein